jgi:hydrogenase nickel incorporation protein HypA/HybF
MHEMSLMADLMKKIDAIAVEHRAKKIIGVHVWLGAMSHMSPDHFRGHFDQGAKGTPAEGACLTIETGNDPNDPHAQDILLRSIEVDD